MNITRRMHSIVGEQRHYSAVFSPCAHARMISGCGEGSSHAHTRAHTRLTTQRHDQRRRAPVGDSQGTRNHRGSESAEARERRLARDRARKWRRLASQSAEE